MKDICIYMCVYMCMHIYIYIERERERDWERQRERKHGKFLAWPRKDVDKRNTLGTFFSNLLNLNIP